MRIVEICMNRGKGHLQVKVTSTRRLVGDPALGWSQRLKVEVGGPGRSLRPGVRRVGSAPPGPATEPGGRPRPVLVVRLDATWIEAASPKARAAGHDKGGFGFHPLTSWATNIGDALAVMQRPGNAGSFTAVD